MQTDLRRSFLLLQGALALCGHGADDVMRLALGPDLAELLGNAGGYWRFWTTLGATSVPSIRMTACGKQSQSDGEDFVVKSQLTT